MEMKHVPGERVGSAEAAEGPEGGRCPWETSSEWGTKSMSCWSFGIKIKKCGSLRKGGTQKE